MGARQTNDKAKFGTGTTSSMLNLNFTYGDPFEIRYRKPFDFFRLRADLSFGSSTHVANNVIGDGFLFGGNIDSSHKMKMLIGGFQHYDYWNTDSFEIGTIGLGAGFITRLPVFKKSNFLNLLFKSLEPSRESRYNNLYSYEVVNLSVISNLSIHFEINSTC